MPIGVELTPAENAALAVALLGYSTRSGSYDFSSLTGFFEKHPKSPGADLLTNLGFEYRNTARTGEAWSKAWALAKGTIEPKVRANADHAAAPFAAANTPPVKAVILAAAAGASSAAPGEPLESGRLVASLALTPYEQWKIDHGLSKDLPDDDDGDGDGIPLLGEFGLGMNPTRPDTTGLPVVSIVGRILQIKYKPVRSDVRYTVEVSTDLINWTTTGVDEAATDSDITAWVPQESDPKKFLRLTVRYVPPVGPNRAPIAQADTANTTIDSAVAISVLANDTDPDGDSLSIVIFGNASNDSVSLSGFQAIYTLNPGYLGNDSFTYTISDGNGGQASATVFIQMAPLPEQGVATSFPIPPHSSTRDKIRFRRTCLLERSTPGVPPSCGEGSSPATALRSLRLSSPCCSTPSLGRRCPTPMACLTWR